MKRLLAVLRTIVLFPLWVAQLPTGYKSFIDNPLLGSSALNGLGLHVWRVRIAARLTARRRHRLRDWIGEPDRTAFDRDGFVVKRDFLSDEHFAQLLAEVRAYRGEVREQVQGDTVTRRIAYGPPTARAMPALQRLQEHPQWRGLIRYAGSFDAEPLVYVQTILSKVVPGMADPQEALHADTFHATVKAWLFLTDVKADDNCFRYVAGSHRLTPERLAWERARSLSPAADRLSGRGSLRIRESELPALGLPPPTSFAVPANTLIVADTHGFHARQPSERGSCRVEIWAYGRRNPFLPWTGVDLGRLPAIGRRRIALSWWIGDLLHRASLARQVWRPKASTGAFDAS